MRLVVLDFETLFDRKEYTLSKLTTEAYIRDPRFKAHGAAIKWSAGVPARWYDEPQLKWVLQNEDWSDTVVVCHHAQFDGLILSHIYGVHPRRMGCTLSMARLLLGNHLSVSLDAVRKHYGLPAKTTPYQHMDGRHWHEMTADVQQMVAEGACDEVESISTLFRKFMEQGFPPEELRVIDLTVRMFTEPVLRADVDMLADLWESENARKSTALEDLGVTAPELQSAARFAELLRAEGIEPEMKPGKAGEIFAFAKTDQFMRDLLEHENERVRDLVQARLGQKSTLLQTRAERLGFMARRGPLAVYLRYCGAHTTRWSGGDKLNFQNFSRGSAIRKAIMAPEGHLLAAIDLSQIECRILNYLAGQNDVIERFRNGEDPYVGIASAFYRRPITKADAMERGTGKQAELSCGYGCGGPKFKATARLGIYGPPVLLSDEEALSYVKLYRRTHPGVAAYWREGDFILRVLAEGKSCEWGPMKVANKKIFLPNGCPLNYDTVKWYVDPETHESGWWMETRNGYSRLYGAKLVENVIQALARVVMSQAMLRIDRLGYRVVTTTHDEIVVLVPRDGREQGHVDACVAEMKREPEWLPAIPLDAEWSLGERYEK